MTVLHSVQYLPTPVVDTLLYTSWSFELTKRQRWPLNCKSMILKRCDRHFVWSHCVNQMIKSFMRKHDCNQVIISFFAEQRCWSRSQMLQWAKSKWLYSLRISIHSRLYSTLNDSIPFSHVHTLVQSWIEEREAELQWEAELQQERELQQKHNPPQSPPHLCIRTWMWMWKSFKKILEYIFE